jgi:hypothetical protein
MRKLLSWEMAKLKGKRLARGEVGRREELKLAGMTNSKVSSYLAHHFLDRKCRTSSTGTGTCWGREHTAADFVFAKVEKGKTMSQWVFLLFCG